MSVIWESEKLLAEMTRAELGTSEAELLKSYPTLRAEDLANAWAYVCSHRAEIERQIAGNESDEPRRTGSTRTMIPCFPRSKGNEPSFTGQLFHIYRPA
jgi:hypothetical protein